MSDETDRPGGRTTVSGGDGVVRLVPPSERAALAYDPGAEIAGRFRVERLLGAGGMGEVYEAIDTTLGQRIALKTVPSERRGGSPAGRDRLDRELVLARRIAHPNVCRAHDLGIDERGGRFVTMELVHGQTLADLLARRGRLSSAEVRAIVRDLATGLTAAHTAGVVHRDLKPANVMITDARDPRGPDRAVIMDFGLARDDDDRLTETAGAGTPAYMAPEQLAGRRVSVATDVHALAVIAAELLTGRRPVGGRPATGDRGWDRLLAPCLRADPAARPSARALLAGLERPPRRRWLGWAAAALSLATTGAAILPGLRGATDDGARVVRADGERFPRGFALGGRGDDNLNALRWHPSGDLVLGGHAASDARLGGARLVADRDVDKAGWVARVAADGRPRWVWRTPGIADVRVVDLAVRADGDVVVVGFYYGAAPALDLPTPAGPTEGFIARLDGARGTARWVRSFATTSHAAPRAVEVVGDGVVVAGEYGGSSRFVDGPPSDAGGAAQARSPFVAAFDGDGRRRWVVAGHGASNARVFALATDGATVWMGGVVWNGLRLGGLDLPVSQDGDGIVLALDAATGATRWGRLVDVDGSGGVGGLAARDGRLVMIGNARGTVHLEPHPLSLDPGGRTGFVAELEPATGAVRWARALDSDSMSNPCCVALAADGHALIAGKVSGALVVGPLRTDGGGDEDAFVVELDRDGQPRAMDRLQGPAMDRFRRIAIGADGRIALAAMFARSTRLGGLAIDSAGGVDGLVVELDRAARPEPAR